MKKIALFSCLALGLMTLAAQVEKQSSTVLAVAPDVPPPDCLPDRCTH